MLTGFFRPWGARSAGHDVIAAASNAQEASIARFSESESFRMGDNVVRVLETRAGMQKMIDIDNVGSGSGRRPHGNLHSKTILRSAAHPRVRGNKRLSGLRRQFTDIVGGRAIDGDAPRLHGLGHFTHELNLEQAIVELSTFHLHIIGKVELAFERPQGDAVIEEIAVGFFGLGAFDG